MKNLFPRNYLLLFFIIILFSLFGGLVGGVVSRVYVFDKIYPLPFFGEIDFSDQGHNGQDIIITGAKKVVVEQETKITETVESTKNSIVGIFKKNNIEIINLKNGISTLNNDENKSYMFNENNFYNLNEKDGQGLIITADGWIISNIEFRNKNKINIIGNYVVITKNKELYEIDDVILDSLTGFYFLHVKDTKDFPVIGFSENKDILGGEIIIFNNYDQDIISTSISGIKEDDNLVKSSDTYFDKIEIVNNLENKKSGFLFNLKGELVALVDDDTISPISHFFSAIDSLLKNKEINRPKIGIYYVNLNNLLIAEENKKIKKYLDKVIIHKNREGVSIEKNSLAEKAGLKENDIIISINNIEINKDNNLTYLVQKYSQGETILIEYVRDGLVQELSIEL